MSKKMPLLWISENKKDGSCFGVYNAIFVMPAEEVFVITANPLVVVLHSGELFYKIEQLFLSLLKTYGRSVHWIRKELRAYELPKPIVIPDKIVAIMDCVFLNAQVVILSYAMLTIAAMFIGAKFRVRQSMSTDAHEIRLKDRVSLLRP